MSDATQQDVERWMQLDIPRLSDLSPFPDDLRLAFQQKVFEVLAGDHRSLGASRVKLDVTKERIFARQAAFLTLVHQSLIDHLNTYRDSSGIDPTESEKLDLLPSSNCIVPSSSISNLMEQPLLRMIGTLKARNINNCSMNTWTPAQRIVLSLDDDYSFHLGGNDCRHVSNLKMICRGVKHAVMRGWQIVDATHHHLDALGIEDYERRRIALRNTGRLLSDLNRSSMASLSGVFQFGGGPDVFEMAASDEGHFLCVGKSSRQFAALIPPDEGNQRVIGCPSDFALADCGSGPQSLTTTLSNWITAAAIRWQLPVENQR